MPKEEETQPLSLAGGKVHLHQLQTSYKSALNLSLDLTPVVKEIETTIGTELGTGEKSRPWHQMGGNTTLLRPSHALADLYCYTNKAMASELKVSYAWGWAYDVFSSQEGRVLLRAFYHTELKSPKKKLN